MYPLNQLYTIPFPKVLTALVLLAFSTQMTFAQQSDVRGRLLETPTNSAALAIDGGASAGIGGIAFANSKFKGTAISTTTAVNRDALPIGSDAAARLGGIEVMGSSHISGMLTDTTTVTNSGGLSFAGCDNFPCRAHANDVGGVAAGSVIDQDISFTGWVTSEGGSGVRDVQMRPLHFLSRVIGRARWPGVRRKQSLGATKPVRRVLNGVGAGVWEMADKSPAVLAIGTNAGIGGILISDSQFSGAAASMGAPVKSVSLGGIGGSAAVRLGGIVIK